MILARPDIEMARHPNTPAIGFVALGLIRVDADGEPHVLDFGLAKWASDADPEPMTMTGQFVGSLPWAAPEQADNSHGVDHRAGRFSSL